MATDLSLLGEVFVISSLFLLAIGYYITPALVGGASGSLISNTISSIANFDKERIRWAGSLEADSLIEPCLRSCP